MDQFCFWEVVKCHNCGKDFEKLKSEILSRQRRGFYNFYCSNRCKFDKSCDTRYLEKAGLASWQEHDLVKFWNNVDKSPGFGPDGDCWKWTGNLSSHSSPYGQFRFNKRNGRAYKFSYLAFKGNIPEGELIRHKCNNTICVNPDHLELGTPLDNSQDMVRAGRQEKGSARHSAKITEETAYKVKELLDQGHGPLAVSRLLSHLGVSQKIAGNISAGWGWQHLWGRTNKVRSNQRKNRTS